MTTPRAICVTGPESTGKTMLARALAVHLGAPWSTEAARAYVEARLAAGGGADLGPEDVEPIARAQLALEDAAAATAVRRGARAVVRDTDLVSTVVYARHYYGACPAWIVAAARARRAALYLLCDVDVPWVADAVRDRPAARGALRAAFAATLTELGCRAVPVGGRWDEREARARAAVQAALGAPPRGTG